MTERSRFIKVRVNEHEYQDLRRRADARGVTMSEHVREVLTTVHEDLDVARALESMRGALAEAMAPKQPEPRTSDDARELEILLLLRELAAARDAQIIGRVRSQVAARTQSSHAGGRR